MRLEVSLMVCDVVGLLCWDLFCSVNLGFINVDLDIKFVDFKFDADFIVKIIFFIFGISVLVFLPSRMLLYGQFWLLRGYMRSCWIPEFQSLCSLCLEDFERPFKLCSLSSQSTLGGGGVPTLGRLVFVGEELCCFLLSLPSGLLFS